VTVVTNIGARSFSQVAKWIVTLLGSARKPSLDRCFFSQDSKPDTWRFVDQRAKPTRPVNLSNSVGSARGLQMLGALAVSTALASSASAQSATLQTQKKIPTIEMSADLFTQLCIDNRTNIAVLIDVFAAEGYTWAPDTKRFVHPTHDISFALLGSDIGFACLMEFANFYDPATSAAVFTKATSSRNVTVNIGIPEEKTDRNYVQATIAAEAQLTQ
jgi:hypothetical protein